MAKMALCIKREELVTLNKLLQHPELKGLMLAELPAGFFRLKTSLEDRATCETDPSLLQLLPYVLIHREDTEQYFVYCRGKGGEEARLHGNLSLGIGGHVDTDVMRVDDMQFPDFELITHLEISACRELEEEVGLKAIPEDIYYGEEPEEHPEDALVIGLDQCRLIHDDTNPVGQVHLGLLYVLNVPDATGFGATEVGVIEGSQWLTVAELQAPAVFDRMENWSKAIIKDLADSSSQFQQVLKGLGSVPELPSVETL